MKRALVVGLLLVGCSSGGGVGAGTAGEPTSPSPAAETVRVALADGTRPILGRIQMRDRTVTLLGARDGLRVTIEDDAGRVLARDVAIDEVRGTDPFVYEMCRSAFVDNRGYLDARLDLGVGEPLR